MSRSRRTALALAAAILAACVAAGATAGAGAAGPSARFEPPTREEAQRWERQFLREEGAARAAAPAPAAKLKGKRLFPNVRVVSVYGAAKGFGLIGRKSVKGAAKKLKKQVKPYREHSHKRVVPAFDLVAVIATGCSGRRDKCRVRVNDGVIQRYLDKIRQVGGRLILDIQPARADPVQEIKHYRNFIRQPNVDVAIDAEWNVKRREEPGQDLGSVSAKLLNRASNAIDNIIDGNGLPPKLLIVHQFRQDSVHNKKRIDRRRKVDTTLNYDGIGGRAAKKAGYRSLSSKRLFNGFSLFYKLDKNLMKPRGVLKLEPKPDYVMYQ